MQKLILFFIVFTISTPKITACSNYAAYGENIRFSLLAPDFMNYEGMDAFQYTSLLYANQDYEDMQEDYQKKTQIVNSSENIELWFHFFDQKISKKNLYKIIYELEISELYSSKTAGLEILKLNKKAFEYILFAKKCSVLNMGFSDPWERNDYYDNEVRRRFMYQAIKASAVETNIILKKRYAYLAIRMSFYNNDEVKIKKIFHSYFNINFQTDAIDYWALHFYSSILPASNLKNLLIAKVFKHSIEKRFASLFMYSKKYGVKKSMRIAKTKDEKTSLLLINSIRRPDKTFESIQEIQKLVPNDEVLYFLIQREINKLEDWIFTPYYTRIETSILYADYTKINEQEILERIKNDRKYALMISNWMKNIKPKSMKYDHWWVLMRYYLKFIGNEKFNQIELNDLVSYQNSKYKQESRFANILFSLISIHQKNSIGIDNLLIQKTLIKEYNFKNDRFIFAMARELEYQGNTTEAAMLFSRVNENNDWDEKFYWKSLKLNQTLGNDYFDSYFFYLDAQYSLIQIENLINTVQNDTAITDFSKWKHAKIVKDMSNLYELLGTKYLRKDNLKKALYYYNKVDSKTWKEEKYKILLSSNPFYCDFYQHSKSDGDTVKFTKVGVINNLISYKKRIKLSLGKRRAYFCLLVGNCYFNMTQFGNSWLMKRYYWTINETRTGFEDDADYFNCQKAKKYYRQAYHSTKNRKIKALMLRMLGKCNDLISLNSNIYHKQLKHYYPDDYEPLISNCESFKTYYAYFK